MLSDALKFDLYELTMAAGYFSQGYNPQVCFELYVRDLPAHRNFLVSAGLEQVIAYLTGLSFNSEQLQYLQNLESFRRVQPAFFEYLRDYRFSGTLYAFPEGTPLFAGQPVLQVEAPLIEAQIIETFLLSTINFQTSVASKAARVVQAAGSDGRERGVMEFGSRRAHGLPVT